MDIISTSHLTKTYRVGVGRARVREMLPPPMDRIAKKLWPRWWLRSTFNALDNVTLSIPRGSSVGIVGHNGAGKTTLLRAIAGVTAPTSGSVSVDGRIAGLLDAVVGYHPDLTGRENIYLLGGLFGLSRRALSTRIRRILDFAQIDPGMVDTQTKRYSAGMAARLGFATLTQLEADALLIDEILVVGDADFQRKCLDWLDQFQKIGGTLVFVSHNLTLLRSMTQRTLWLDHGSLRADGPTLEIVREYVRASEQRDVDQHRYRHPTEVRKAAVHKGLDRWGAGGARVDEVHIDDGATDGSSIGISISYEAPDLKRAIFCVAFADEGGRQVGATASKPFVLDGRGGRIHCVIGPVPLRSGIYFPVVAILSPDGVVRDHWKLDRAIVIDQDGEFFSDFAPVAISAAWATQ